MRLRFAVIVCLFFAAIACDRSEPGPPATTFTCGDSECRIAQEYCRKAFPGAVSNPQETARMTCEPLPLPDCKQIERSGRCLGSPETGLIVEIYFP